MKTVRIDLVSEKSFKDAAKAIEKLAKKIDEAGKKIALEAAESGAMTARTAYGPDIAVNVTRTENGAVIEAIGPEVMFLEFGAGAATLSGGGAFPDAEAATGTRIERGAYSDLRKGPYMRSGYISWIPPGETEPITEVYPSRGLYQAEQEVIEFAGTRAREELSKL